MKFREFIGECHKKDVFKILSIYVVSSWVLLQVLAVTWEALGIPQITITYLIIFLLAGFPVYIFLVWKFHVAPIKKKEILRLEKNNHTVRTFHKIYFSALGIIATLCIITIFIIVGNTFSANTLLPPKVQTDKIAVLKFGNNTGDPKYDVVGKMVADWVIHGITQNHLGQVISQEVISQYSAALKGEKKMQDQDQLVTNYLQPSKIISGNFYLDNDTLIFQSSIIDGKTQKTLISFKPSSCMVTNSLDCIRDVAESVTGFLATASHRQLMLQDMPPKYDSYRYLLEAKNISDSVEHLEMLNKALEADPDYFEPKVLKVAFYYNEGDYRTADSLLKSIKPDTQGNQRQLNLLNMYDATLRGNNKRAYEAILREYHIAPFDLLTNRTAMVVALQFVNRPKEVEAMYSAIKPDSMDFENCTTCIQRVYVKCLADVELGNYSSAIESAKMVLSETDSDILVNPMLSAMVRDEKYAALEKFFTHAEIASFPKQLCDWYIFAGKEFLLTGKKGLAQEYFEKALDLAPQFPDSDYKAEALFFLDRFQEAGKEYAGRYANLPSSAEYLGKLAICNLKDGKTSQARTNLESLEKLRGDFQFGEIDYVLAEYFAVANKPDAMYEHLLKSVAAGQLFTSHTFQNDPLFRNYIKSDKFKQVLKYWH